eukprot:scaffold314335_cov35-Tisochrysis_lutea.AAC.1
MPYPVTDAQSPPPPRAHRVERITYSAPHSFYYSSPTVSTTVPPRFLLLYRASLVWFARRCGTGAGWVPSTTASTKMVESPQRARSSEIPRISEPPLSLPTPEGFSPRDHGDRSVRSRISAMCYIGDATGCVGCAEADGPIL